MFQQQYQRQLIVDSLRMISIPMQEKNNLGLPMRRLFKKQLGHLPPMDQALKMSIADLAKLMLLDLMVFRPMNLKEVTVKVPYLLWKPAQIAFNPVGTPPKSGKKPVHRLMFSNSINDAEPLTYFMEEGERLVMVVQEGYLASI